MYCSNCGRKNDDQSSYCSQCGLALNDPVTAPGVQTLVQATAPSSPRQPSTANLGPAMALAGSVAETLPTAASTVQSAGPELAGMLDKLSASLVNPVLFVIGYAALMIPTYILPYLGSNSSVINSLGAATGAGLNPALWVHVAALAGLVLISWLRGKVMGKPWLGTLPFAALLFDLLPGLSMIPMVPTALHVVTIVLGLKDDAKR